MSNTDFLKPEKILIYEGKVFIDNVETTNPELIGYAILDFAETKITKVDSESIALKFEKYIEEKGLRRTYEREHLLRLLLTMLNNFKSIDFVDKGYSKLNISRATSYSFINSCVDAGILSINHKTYKFN